MRTQLCDELSQSRKEMRCGLSYDGGLVPSSCWFISPHTAICSLLSPNLKDPPLTRGNLKSMQRKREDRNREKEKQQGESPSLKALPITSNSTISSMSLVVSPAQQDLAGRAHLSQTLMNQLLLQSGDLLLLQASGEILEVHDYWFFFFVEYSSESKPLFLIVCKVCSSNSLSCTIIKSCAS